MEKIKSNSNQIQQMIYGKDYFEKVSKLKIFIYGLKGVKIFF